MTSDKPRYRLIDTLRGAAILSMIAYHLCYDIFVAYGLSPMWYAETPVILWERSIAVTFFLVSGISQHFSSHPYRNGLIVNACGVAITLITFLVMPEQRIIFGVLNCLGCCMLLCALCRKAFCRVHPALGAILSFLLFSLSYGVPFRYIGFFGIKLLPLPDGLYSADLLAPLGFHSATFFSADYFPLIPWVFLYFCGWFLWGWIARAGWERFFIKGVPALDFIGRHSLIIYLAHQPLLYAACALCFGHL